MDLFDDDMDEFSEGFDQIFEAPSTCYSFSQDFQDEDESDDADFQRTPRHAKSVAALEKKFISQAIPITSGYEF